MKAVSVVPVSLLAVVIAASALSGCATSDEVRLRLRVKELERERDALMFYSAKQDRYINELQEGMVLQAQHTANLMNNCDI